ncbi:patatin-like phospholipase family protein [Palleronia sp. LCG004]|uniref:patatin-like phospholipase family protein n=1 Tax=Palleronia sp. LCG004 TaxID=3079304 RepID=UPI002942FEBB|nr:patatin-like phospholipase family protein [Palleronia sp. LCG004]WOI57233.1 patatin-like phospholipase family protein [Palleronia sp. LCG004]
MTRPKINLALQGGGAHGAFTWGVLDRLLEGNEVEIAAITGTSAGALNGAAVKAGLIESGPEGARAALDWVWSRVGQLADLAMPDWLQPFLPTTPQLSHAIEMSPPYALGDFIARTTSPYSYGPFYRNPLEPIVRDMHFGRICAGDGPALFICATNVRSGKIRIFSGEEITPDAIMASACLPTLFQAVEIPGEDGTLEAYWDGGYSGNPALFPLFRPELPSDIVIVNINPLYRDDLPYAPHEIMNRVNEISFNSSLLRELRSIHFVQRLLDDGTIAEGAMKRLHIHMISDDDLMADLSVATKTVPSALIIQRLKEAGRKQADRFIETQYDALGTRPSVDLREMFD